MTKKNKTKSEKKEPKPKLTDTERHKRFVDMAHEVVADESQEAFDTAFGKVVASPPNRQSNIGSAGKTAKP